MLSNIVDISGFIFGVNIQADALAVECCVNRFLAIDDLNFPELYAHDALQHFFAKLWFLHNLAEQKIAC